MKSHLTKKDIFAAFRALNEKLAEAGTMAEICLYGGTAMVLAFNARLSTIDMVERFYPKERIAPKTQFFVLECVNELKDEPQNPS